MDWQIRLALILIGLVLIGYIYFDYNKKKKIKNENERLKRQFSGLDEQIDNAGFDRNGVSVARISNPSGSSINDFIDEQTTPKTQSENDEPLRTEPVFEEPQLNKTHLKATIEVEQTDIESEGNFEASFDAELEISIESNLESLNDLSTNHESNSEAAEHVPFQKVQLSELKEDGTDNARVTTEENSGSHLNSDSNLNNNVNVNVQEQLVFSFILQAPSGETFKGKDFLPLFLSQGLRHGDMEIFHRHQKTKVGSKSPGAVLFSLANAIAPGTFILASLELFETPALALFMTLPGPGDAQIAYNAMLNTARLLQTELGGELLDETKSKYTEQVHNHRLDQIQEFNRKGFIL